MNHALSNKGVNPLGFFCFFVFCFCFFAVFWGKELGVAGGMKVFNQECDLCRVPEKKISHHSCPGCICFNGLSLKFGVSVKQFLDVLSQVIPSERECWAAL